MTTQTNLPAQQGRPKPPSGASTIVANKQLIAEALPRGLDHDRFTRLALTTLRKTPKLQDCDPQSFVGSLLTAIRGLPTDSTEMLFHPDLIIRQSTGPHHGS